MLRRLVVAVTTAAVVTACAASESMPKSEAKNMSHMHMGHVLTSWQDTPEKKGLLPIARAEAEIAITHAGLAAKKPGDLAWMQMHTKHVLHAVDASKIKTGPGLGYGVRKAAQGVVKHINLAANSADASDNVKQHAVHVSASANNTDKRAAEMVKLVDKILQAQTAGQAVAYVSRMNEVAQQLIDGEDANGDGQITWHEGEGGLAVVEKHMAAMAKAEGM